MTIKKAQHVCIVTTGHPSTNPRAVKEADTLITAGYQVTFIHGEFIQWACDVDIQFANRPWVRRAVRFGPLAAQTTRLRQKLIQVFAKYFVRIPINYKRELLLAWAMHPIAFDLSRTALKCKADFYLAHNLAALPVAGLAAVRYSAKLGFDFEDDHLGELPMQPQFSLERKHREQLLRFWLPRCAHLTASAPLISHAIQSKFGLEIETILNVFPIEHDLQEQSKAKDQLTIRCYWFSQTIGAGRGLEEIIQIFGGVDHPIELHLRGNVSASYKAALSQHAEQYGLASTQLFFWPPAPPNKMVQMATSFDLGLCVEREVDDNKSRCLANKIFQYLLAGVPVLLSNTPAHCELAKELSSAALLIDLAEVKNASTKITAWAKNKTIQIQARNHASKISRTRFNWEQESPKFLASVERALSIPISVAAAQRKNQI